MVKKKKSLTRRLIVAAVALALVGAFVYVTVLAITRKASTDDLKTPDADIHYFDYGETYTMENDSLCFVLNDDTTFSVTDKATGTVWYSNPQDLPDLKTPDSGSSEAEGLLRSTLILHYTTETMKDATSWNNFTYSIENHLYSVEQREDGSIAVTYLVRIGGRIRMLPTAITIDRMK